MGRRERQRRVRGEEAEALVRAQLEPLEPGEVPRPIKIAVVIAAAIAIFNPIAFATGYELTGQKATWTGVILLSAVMVVDAIGMWRLKYWAVLGFLALMAVSCIFAAFALAVFSNLEGFVRSLLVMVGSGAMFWSLIRPLARIQMPERPNRLNGHG